MKKNYYLIGLMLLMMAFIAMDATGQTRYVDVDPGIGTLNDSISKDTTALGERIDPENTVYRLQRGDQAYYGLTGSISNSGYPLTIVAADGDGARPFLQPIVEDNESSRAFRPRGNITLKGLHVTNMDDIGGLNDRILRCSADDIQVTIDNCWFDQTSQSFIRVDDPGMSFKITNSVVSNIGQPKDPNNGRGIDDRGNDIDTVIIENSTFFNVTSRVIRDDGGVIKYARLINNTLANIGQMGITFGSTEMLEMKNNLMMNAGFMPMDDAVAGRIVLSVDSVSIDAETKVAPVVIMSNNSAYMDTTKITEFLSDTTNVTPFMNATLMAAIVTNPANSPNFNLNVEFTDGAPFNDSIMIYKYDPDLDRANTPEWEVPEVPGIVDGGNGLYHLDVYYDFGYVHSKAFVAGAGGTQLGDLNWTADRGMLEMVDFEDYSDNHFWNQFANAGDAPENMGVVLNPDMSGINTSVGAMMFTVLDGADPWAGAWSNAYGYMEFTQEKHHMEMMVHKDVISNSGLKLEGGLDGAANVEHLVPNTVTGEWELLTFDMTDAIGNTYTNLVFFPDFPDPRVTGSMNYLDNIKIITSPVGVETRDDLSLRVYPNPVTDQLIVEHTGMTSIVVMDILGKQVKSVDLSGEDSAKLGVSDLADGIYFITVEAAGNTVTTKFLKR